MTSNQPRGSSGESNIRYGMYKSTRTSQRSSDILSRSRGGDNIDPDVVRKTLLELYPELHTLISGDDISPEDKEVADALLATLYEDDSGMPELLASHHNEVSSIISNWNSEVVIMKFEEQNGKGSFTAGTKSQQVRFLRLFVVKLFALVGVTTGAYIPKD